MYWVKKLNTSYYAINKLKLCLPLNSILDVYYSLVYSHLQYNILLWGASVDVNRIFIAQKRIMRMIFNVSPLSSCRPLFIEHRILTVPCIYIYKSLMNTRRNLRNLVGLSNYHNYFTRNQRTLCLPQHRTTKFELSPSYKGIKIFNNLPERIKILNEFRFRDAIKRLLIEKAYYSVGEYMTDGQFR